MSLADFQRAFSRALLDPAAWIALLRGPAPPPGLRLTPRERARLLQILLHPGMAANRLLLRANRMQPLHGALPLTCDWLREEMEPLIEAWLRRSADASIQYEREAQRFAEWLPGFLRGGAPHPALDALRYERGLAELVRRLPAEGAAASVRLWFEHDPDVVLAGYQPGVEPLASPLEARLAIREGMVVLERKEPRCPRARATAAERSLAPAPAPRCKAE